VNDEIEGSKLRKEAKKKGRREGRKYLYGK
jgi:hypothetical protein